MIGNYSDLAGKTFMVTGASSGIGQAIAIALSDQGAEVIITGRNSERLASTQAQLKNKSHMLSADLVVEAERDQLVAQLPQLDGVCHCAGIINPFPIRYLDQAQFDKVFAINATAPILLTSRLLGKKKLNDHASLVFMSSVSGNRAMKGGSMYTISKAAIEAFSRSITLEHASKGIRSNCLRPGLVDTGMLDQAKELALQAGSEAKMEAYKNLYLLGLGTTSDVTAATLFFLSDASRWVTGTGLTLDGGLSTQI